MYANMYNNYLNFSVFKEKKRNNGYFNNTSHKEDRPRLKYIFQLIFTVKVHDRNIESWLIKTN